MQKIVGNPPFVKVFKDHASALKAIGMLVAAKENGYTNKQILGLGFFTSLFNQDYVNTVTQPQFEWRLKNIARDLKKMKFEDLNIEWHEYKKYFEATRRKAS